MRYAVVLIAVISLVGGAYGLGRHDGAALIKADLAKLREASREATSKLETTRLAAQALRDEFTRQLEDAAHAEPVNHPDALSLERVRRLNSIR